MTSLYGVRGRRRLGIEVVGHGAGDRVDRVAEGSRGQPQAARAGRSGHGERCGGRHRAAEGHGNKQQPRDQRSNDKHEEERPKHKTQRNAQHHKNHENHAHPRRGQQPIQDQRSRTESTWAHGIRFVVTGSGWCSNKNTTHRLRLVLVVVPVPPLVVWQVT